MNEDDRARLQSRVSSSSSSHHSQSYQLIPREEPFSNMRRDLPSPRTSLPFKKVRPGIESSSVHQSLNNSSLSARDLPRRQIESRELIDAIGELNQSPNPPRRVQEQGQIGLQISHEECQAKIEELQRTVVFLEKQIEDQRLDTQLEKKANQIYSNGFNKLRDIAKVYQCSFEGEGIEELVQRLEQVLKRHRGGRGGESQDNWMKLLEQQENKISQLRAQLVRSSQNNINAIFNTEITQAHCLHLQVRKMNGQILSLRQNLVRVTANNQSNTNQMPRDRVVNVYHHGSQPLDSSEEDVNTELKLTRRRPKHSRSRSRHRSSTLVHTQTKIGELLEGYRSLREQYKRLEHTLVQVHDNQGEYRHLFQSLRIDIGQTLANQLREVKQTIQRPSSSHLEKRGARDVEFKLNHLMNTLNAPERVNIQPSSLDDEASDWKNVEVQRKIIDLQSHNTHLQQDINHLQTQNQDLKRRLWVQERQQMGRSLPLGLSTDS